MYITHQNDIAKSKDKYHEHDTHHPTVERSHHCSFPHL